MDHFSIGGVDHFSVVVDTKLETRSPVIPTEVEESYARPQDPSTALRYVQDDALFFLVTRNSPLLYSSIIFVKHVPQ